MTETDFNTKLKALYTEHTAALAAIEDEYQRRRRIVDEGLDWECERLLNDTPKLSDAGYSAQLVAVFARRDAELAPVASSYVTDVQKQDCTYLSNLRALNSL